MVSPNNTFYFEVDNSQTIVLFHSVATKQIEKLTNQTSSKPSVQS